MGQMQRPTLNFERRTSNGRKRISFDVRRSALDVRRSHSFLFGEPSDSLLRQPANAPVGQHGRAESLVEPDRWLVPIKNRPLQAPTVSLLRDAGQFSEECFADPPAAPLWQNEQVFQ